MAVIWRVWENVLRLTMHFAMMISLEGSMRKAYYSLQCSAVGKKTMAISYLNKV